jgi:transposase
MEHLQRKAYPTGVTDDEWAFVSPYLTLMREDAEQRHHSMREVFNALRWIVRAGASWRMLPHDFPPWAAVYQQTQRWIAAAVFETMVHDLRVLLRVASGRERQPTAVILDGRTLQSTPESGHRAGYDGAKKRKGSKTHIAVDTLGTLLAVHVTPANEQERAQVATLAAAVQEVTGEKVEIAFVDQGYTGEQAEADVAEHGMRLEVIKLPEAKKGFVLLPRRWVVERSFAWMAKFRRLARDYERLPETVAGLHFVAFACLMLHRVMPFLTGSA